MNRPGPAVVLEVRGLTATAGAAALLDDVGLTVEAGRVLAVLGPSGAGKSTLGLALLGESDTGVTLGGSVRTSGTELLGLGPAALRRARAGRVGHLPQHPGVVLDPVRRTGPVLDELAAIVHGSGRARRAARTAAVEDALERAGLGAEPRLALRFPHQLSGGQQQRMALAQTLVTAPDVVVLDEPTTGLDPVTTDAVVGRLAALAAGGTALVLLTHDLDTARRLADEVLLLDGGRVVRRGDPATVLGPPAPRPARPAPRTAGAPLLVVTGLGVRAADGTPLLSGVDLTLERGECLAVTGPSGAGKTTLGRALAGLAPHSGDVVVDGGRYGSGSGSGGSDSGGGSSSGGGGRGPRAVQYVHQDCRSAFLDHRPVLDQVARPAVLLRGLPVADARSDARALLERLGLSAETVARRPGELSGGQLQRASVARALLARPAVLIADEATSALDGAHRRLLLDELARARRDDGLAVLLISHDPATVAVADRVLALADGRIAGDAAEPAGAR
ncbi:MULTISPECIES: ABC transporter ATP-binding protein [Pseudonocardia]|uniref:Glutathione import ATP-binding protein GsiA n=2 Tax=Pseudonocardia TaxID=1847 RepID=A0A1Y2NA98_PSEAH|nr:MULTISPECIES: ATP-binding cassette domain-containing protein [Pseudonocardia]OSY44089.1 Glutathione import ATP-binding protein GsiA [Pseudonocardia autotrophica]TDN74182.1 peptide/nickel transport system ATP-binding protein [Pseudonocardia autotrophica]BBG04941.1 ABC transporter ATP-binding protein [Pseudonocardia autotrophica]GEC23597.1 ABC transporter ATP-binding protein [Pseudonocardia saturnea]